jgi:hypothetical protein
VTGLFVMRSVNILSHQTNLVALSASQPCFYLSLLQIDAVFASLHHGRSVAVLIVIYDVAASFIQSVEPAKSVIFSDVCKYNYS